MPTACGGRSCIPQETGRHTIVPTPGLSQTGKPPLTGQKTVLLPAGAGSRKSYHSYLCAVLSGDGIALLPTPGTGISKPLTVDERHDTDDRWRQVTKLPRPCPQYPPFTLRYGNVSGFLLADHGSGMTSAGYRPFGFPLVPLMLSC